LHTYGNAFTYYNMQMTHGSLFSGIGGFDLAAEWMGWENKFHCEWNPFGQRVLKHYWPNSESFTDITKTDFTKYYGAVDIISGGFPCQPYSSAGKRLGKEDERHLWPEMLRAIREISPRFVVGENVRGLTNWNGGLVFEEVCAELESYGYQIAPVIIPACGVGAPHRRERIWFVAQNPLCSGCLLGEIEQKGAEIWQQRNTSARGADGVYISEGFITDSKRGRHGGSSETQRTDFTRLERKLEENIGQHRHNVWGETARCSTNFSTNANWDNFPTKSPICGGNDGISRELDGITFSKWRNESIKAYGNAIVPQVAYQIFKALELCK
jgi:DNA (cytosine-5)-methyltransferase 1